MVNLWHKYKNATKRQKQALHSLIVGFALFCFFSIITKYFSFSLCIAKNIFGTPCPGCGLTRGFLAILRFDFKAALYHNVLSLPLFIGIVIYAVLCITDILLNRNDLEKAEQYCKKKHMLILLLCVFILSIFLNRQLK